jgi:ABC-type molybdate transport system substrate-binding protein
MNEVNFIKYGYEDEQRLFAMVMTGEIDLFITGEDVIERYAESEWFDDMRTFLPEEDLKRYESEDRVLEYKGVPIAVKVDDSAILKEYFYYNGRQDVEVYAGFPAGSTQRRLAGEFVQYLLDTPAKAE